MKRSLILSLCAVIVAALGMSAVQAQTDIALNLKYTDPADPSEGGEWTLVAKSADPNSNGLTALVSRYTNIDPNSIVINGSIGHDIGVSGGVFGSAVEIVYGQDPNDGLTSGAGQVGGPSDQGADPLLNSAWDNASVIATGTFGASRPDNDPNSSAGGNFENTLSEIVSTAVGLNNVRGDSENSLGLESGTGLFAGDLNRDGAVGPSDLGTLGINWDPTGTTNGWDDGDFNDDGAVGPSDLGTLGINWDPVAGDFIPPAIGAVPEPSSLILAALALGLALRRRA